MRKPTVQNIYNLTVPMIKKLKVNRDKIKDTPFWRNDVVGAWCISGSTANCAKDREYGTYNEYWLGVYDEDAKSHAGKIRVEFYAYGGMCKYTFTKFYNSKDIENELDLRIQEQFLKVMNNLIEQGVFILSE